MDSTSAPPVAEGLFETTHDVRPVRNTSRREGLTCSHSRLRVDDPNGTRTALAARMPDPYARTIGGWLRHTTELMKTHPRHAVTSVSEEHTSTTGRMQRRSSVRVRERQTHRRAGKGRRRCERFDKGDA
ncbi:hypothetical protein METUNv1_00262 [Methyloversatilis universalis FAM5]|uniref:Uncharacterized protein n=1 Tax=Methyloversatilis universalis (strain ATCC BAA-1314 / DSM 25237 / JCM 13912 / CCUG 52030 / FAM5) TaxID=1000565 RepID=F5R7R4_METUF|nr:hypothetical protein METUNv1_00262 [Methyloversatilis universalis FAM5]